MDGGGAPAGSSSRAGRQRQQQQGWAGRQQQTGRCGAPQKDPARRGTHRPDKEEGPRGEDVQATPSRTVRDIEGGRLRFHVFVDTGELFNRGRFVLLLGKLSVRHPARSAN